MRLFFAIAIGFVPLGIFMLFLILSQERRKQKTKTPFTSYLLRPPGESLRLRLEKLDEEVNDKLLYLVACCIFVGFGGWVWQDSVILSVVIACVALIPFAYFARNLFVILNLRRDCYLGFLGERALGEELNRLLANGWSVFHDVEFSDNPGAKPFNVDHVVVGTGGLFAIETKTRRKQVKHSKQDPKNEVIYNGATLQYPWGEENYGVRDARERAEHLARWLSKNLGGQILVQPVLALPGWSVKRRAGGDLRVISGKEILALFRDEHEKKVLDPQTVKAIAALLDQKCRDVGV